MKLFGKNIHSAVAITCATTIVAVLRVSAQSTGGNAPAAAPNTQLTQNAGAQAGALAALVGDRIAAPVAQAAAAPGNDSVRKPETVALPPGDRVFAYTMGNDGIRRTIVKRADGSTYVLGGEPVPRSGPNNFLNRPFGEELPPNYGLNNFLNRPLGEEAPPTYGTNNFLNRPLGEDAPLTRTAPGGQVGPTSTSSHEIPRTQERPGTGNPHAVRGSDQEDPNAQRPTYSEEREKALREGVVRKAGQSGHRPH